MGKSLVMKIFAVYSTLNFTRKPDWLDGFGNKYNYPYLYHVTLKQPTYIQENEIVDIKKILTRFFEEATFPQHKIDIVFDKLVVGTPIMIESAENKEINILQHEIVTALKGYNNFVKPESKSWEENFKPHLTITADLEGEKLEQAKRDLGKDVHCDANINEIVLVIAPDMTSSEDSKEKTIYKL